MHRKLVWTPLQDGALRRLRGEGRDWAAIAVMLGTSRNAAMERARVVGARLPRRPTGVLVRLADPDRPALRPGHPVSWGALVGGTVLADEPYPVPVPMGRLRRNVIGEMC